MLPVLAHSQTQTLKYEWRKVSGPSQYKIVTPNSAVTNVTDLVEGVYKFELKVTNSRGLSSRDTMVLTVSAADQNNFAKNSKRTKLGSATNSSTQ